jgi:hypothetical protein
VEWSECERGGRGRSDRNGWTPRQMISGDEYCL